MRKQHGEYCNNVQYRTSILIIVHTFACMCVYVISRAPVLYWIYMCMTETFGPHGPWAQS